MTTFEYNPGQKRTLWTLTRYIEEKHVKYMQNCCVSVSVCNCMCVTIAGGTVNLKENNL